MFDFPAAVSALVAGIVSAVVVEAVRRHAVRFGLMDLPNPRSTHLTPTPRGGGIGILAGLVAGIVIVAIVAPGRFGPPGITLLVCSLVVGAIGFIDDRMSLSAYSRLGVHLTMAVILAWTLGPLRALPLPKPLDLRVPYLLGFSITVLWLTAITNFFNFMDGIDGLAGGQAAASSIGIVIAAWSSDAVAASGALAAGSLGFLVHNWPPARVFMGDVGSGALGFFIAGLPLLAPVENQPRAVLAVAIGLAFFIFDPVWTLARRMANREPILQAHRQHLYQIIVPAGTVHRRATLALVAGALLLSLAGAISFRDARIAWTAAAIAAVLCFAKLLFALRMSRV